MAAKKLTLIINILLIILFVGPCCTSSFYALFLQHLNFSPSQLGFVRASQIWVSALLIPVWKSVPKEQWTVQRKRIVIAICAIALMGLHVSLTFFPSSMSCLFRDVTHCHPMSVLHDNTKNVHKYEFNDANMFHYATKGELLTKTTPLKHNFSELRNLKKLFEKPKDRHNEISFPYTESTTSSTSRMIYTLKEAHNKTIGSLVVHSNKSSNSLNNGNSKLRFYNSKLPMSTIDDQENILQNNEQRFPTVYPAIYNSPERKILHPNGNIVFSNKLKQTIPEIYGETLNKQQKLKNNHYGSTVQHQIADQEVYTTDKVTTHRVLNEYSSKTLGANSYSLQQHLNSEDIHSFDENKWQPNLNPNIVTFRQWYYKNNNKIPPSADKSQRLIEAVSHNSQQDRIIIPPKAYRFRNSPNDILSKDSEVNENSRTATRNERNKSYSNTLPNFIASAYTRHSLFKPVKTVLTNDVSKQKNINQMVDKGYGDLGKNTSLLKTYHIEQKRGKFKKSSKQQQTLYTFHPYWDKHFNKRSVYSLLEEKKGKLISKQNSKKYTSNKCTHDHHRKHDTSSLHHLRAYHWQNKRVKSKRSEHKHDMEEEYYILRNLKSVKEEINHSHVPEIEISKIKMSYNSIQELLGFSIPEVYTFSFVFFLVILAEVISTGIMTVCKKFCLENRVANPDIVDFQIQQWTLRVWGIIICPLLLAVVLNTPCAYQPRIFFLSAALLLLITTPPILFTLPIPEKTKIEEKAVQMKDNKLVNRIGSHCLTLISGFGTACNFEFIFWHINMQQDFTFNYQILYCSYISLRALAHTSAHFLEEHMQKKSLLGGKRNKTLQNIASRTAVGLHALEAVVFSSTWTIVFLGLTLGSSDAFRKIESAGTWWTSGYGFGCLFGGYVVGLYGTQLLFQGVAVVMFASCVLEILCYGYSKCYGYGCKRQTVYSKLLLLPEGEDFSEEEIVEEGDDWLERALQKDELKQQKLHCKARD